MLVLVLVLVCSIDDRGKGPPHHRAPHGEEYVCEHHPLHPRSTTLIKQGWRGGRRSRGAAASAVCTNPHRNDARSTHTPRFAAATQRERDASSRAEPPCELTALARRSFVDFVDNSTVLELLEGAPRRNPTGRGGGGGGGGVLAAVSDECLMPNGADAKLAARLDQLYNGHAHYRASPVARRASNQCAATRWWLRRFAERNEWHSYERSESVVSRRASRFALLRRDGGHSQFRFSDAHV